MKVNPKKQAVKGRRTSPKNTLKSCKAHRKASKNAGISPTKGENPASEEAGFVVDDVGLEVRNELFAIPTPLETVVFPVSEAVLAGSNHARSDGYEPLTQPKGTIREQKIRPYMCLQRRIW